MKGRENTGGKVDEMGHLKQLFNSGFSEVRKRFSFVFICKESEREKVIEAVTSRSLHTFGEPLRKTTASQHTVSHMLHRGTPNRHALSYNVTSLNTRLDCLDLH